MNRLEDREFVCMELLVSTIEDLQTQLPRGWKSRLARSLNVSPAYITLIASGKRIPSLYVYNNILKFANSVV